MSELPQDPLFGAAVLKLSFLLKGRADEPGFRVVYYGALKDLGLVNSQVDAYIAQHRALLEAHIRGKKDG
ncbi:MAG: hypothetical protein PHU25_11015 [Deltaproteobacteria bacterium]|nr:hypothetical protein [Deltaproteobacteria bacterium]